MNMDVELSIHDIFKKIKEQQEKYVECRDDVEKNKHALSCLDDKIDSLKDVKKKHEKEQYKLFESRAQLDCNSLVCESKQPVDRYQVGLRELNGNVSTCVDDYVSSKLRLGEEMLCSLESLVKKSEIANLLDKAKDRYLALKKEEKVLQSKIQSPQEEQKQSNCVEMYALTVLMEYKKKLKLVKSCSCDTLLYTLRNGVSVDALQVDITRTCHHSVSNACLEHWKQIEHYINPYLDSYIQQMRQRKQAQVSEMDVMDRKHSDYVRKQSKEIELQSERISTLNRVY